MATVFCSRLSCRKEYHESFKACPFCGAPNTNLNEDEALAGTKILKKRKLLITTSHAVDNAEITDYLDVVTVNMVIGTNIFKDMFASFSDIFGGFSGKYKEQLDAVYAKGLEEVKDKAVELDANAVIGLQVDFSEISGNDKSMFMVAITGTAVKIKKLPNYRRLRLRQELKSFLADGLMTQEEYDQELKKLDE